MKDSLLILVTFILGIGLGRGNLLPAFLLDPQLAGSALLGFMFVAGLAIGSDPKIGRMLKAIKWRVLLLPCATITGTFFGATLCALFLPLTLPECLAIGSGFGYYSLSSIFIGQYKGPELGTIALVSNILRELITLLFMPLLAKWFGPLAAISCGGATTMDTTLPSVTRYCGNIWIMPAVIHAMILDASVPLWVTLFCSF